ncbi:hypothetical protein ACOSQ4_027995 [Xanthoceras sorbifolium]
MGLTFLAQVGMPLSFWWEAFDTAVYTLNRLPTVLLNDHSPYFLAFNRIPHYADLKPLHTGSSSVTASLPCVPAVFQSRQSVPQPPSLSTPPSAVDVPPIVLAALADPKWDTAIQAEFDVLLRNKTWSLVPSSKGMNVVGCKWIFRVKYKADGSIERYKARLVAKGFHQTPGLNFTETFSPVVKSSTIRIILALAISSSWDSQHIDVNNGFLNGDLQEAVYMSQPEGFIHPSQSSLVCHLHKSLYGLKQAPKAWYDKLKMALQQWGFINSKSDSSLFYFKSSTATLFVLIYVDDILVTGSDSTLISLVIRDLNVQFYLKSLGSLQYFLGFEAYQNVYGLTLTQTKYAWDLLVKTKMTDSKSCSTPLSPNCKLSAFEGSPFDDATLYRSTVGALQYLTLTRPDLSFSVNKLSQFLAAPTQVHWQAVKRVLRYIRSTLQCGLQFTPSSSLTFEGFANADWASNPDDRRSTGGYCLYLGGNLICWSLRKQRVVARSSTEAEYRSLASAATNVVWVQSLLAEIQVNLSAVPLLWCDNISANSLAHNPVFHARTKHIEIDIHFLRDLIAEGRLEIRYVSTAAQTADIFTKSLPISRFLLLCTKLIVDRSQLRLRGSIDDVADDQSSKLRFKLVDLN